ncbi:hypothetical protein D3C72_1613220 [compost metagenome]
MNNRVRETKGQVECFTLGLSAVTHTHQVQLFLKTLANTNDHIVQQCAQGSGHGTCELAVVLGGKFELVINQLDFNISTQCCAQRAESAFYSHFFSTEFHFYASRDDYRVFCYARHSTLRLGYDAEQFAADTGCTCFTISHHTT